MGAETFTVKSNGKTAKEAFNNAVEEAQYDYGHAGYTGTIAEKSNFVMFTLPEGKDAEEYAEEVIEKGDKRINDKWGPAGCIDCGDELYLFFGWASS